MTYCLAMRLDEGLLFLADTRTNAGVDDVGVVRKLHVLMAAPDRVLVLASAGNLGTTQEVLDRLGRDPARLTGAAHLFEAALGVGEVGQEVVAEHKEALGNADATASFILGGQIGDDPPDLLRIYPEGNYIRASEDRPFLQIGETKYGKFILELGAARSDWTSAGSTPTTRSWPRPPRSGSATCWRPSTSCLR
jgi:putative proteasome-type protease